jgi:hypothetical protein
VVQLWKVGWMPNYMRHVTAGFLVEFLGLDWRAGERWYHDTLIDADVAINAYVFRGKLTLAFRISGRRRLCTGSDLTARWPIYNICLRHRNLTI